MLADEDEPLVEALHVAIVERGIYVRIETPLEHGERNVQRSGDHADPPALLARPSVDDQGSCLLRGERLLRSEPFEPAAGVGEHLVERRARHGVGDYGARYELTTARRSWHHRCQLCFDDAMFARQTFGVLVLVFVLGLVFAGTIIGLVTLWPDRRTFESPFSSVPDSVPAEVAELETVECTIPG